MMQTLEQSSCTEDRIQHVLERCLSHLGLDALDKQLWNAGLSISRWCLEELVKRDPNNFLILLQKILMKTTEVLEECQYELVVPLTLLFSLTLQKTPYVAPDCDVLHEGYLLFHNFLSWPEPCSSASKRLLSIIQQELKAPGISFQRLIRAEQGISQGIHSSKTIIVMLVSPDDDIPPEVQTVSKQLSATKHSSRDITITLILHSLQAVLGPKYDMQTILSALQNKQPEELEQLLEAVTNSMEIATSAADVDTAREGLLHSLEGLRESFGLPGSAGGYKDSGAAETFTLPVPKCYMRTWEKDNFDILKEILVTDSELDSPPDCFLKTDLDENDNDTSLDEEDELDGNRFDCDFQNHRFSTASLSSRDSTFSSNSICSRRSVPSLSSGVESDFSEDMAHEDADERQDSQPKQRKKPRKKSRSLLGIERLSVLFKNPRSPSTCRRVQSMGNHGDFCKDVKNSTSLSRKLHPLDACTPPLSPLYPQKHVCMRRRPILSCDEGSVAEVPTLVKVVVFGGDREAGRLARAYSDLQQKERKCPQLTKMCKLQFYFVPMKRSENSRGGHTPTEGHIGSLTKTAASVESNIAAVEDSTTNIAQMLGMMDPWYERNVLGLLELSSDVLCQAASKDDDVSLIGNSTDPLSLLADLVLYYCRQAGQPVLVQLYQAELTLAGGEKRREVFIHSLELGHTAGTRAVKAMGSASKRFGIDEEREAVPLTVNVAYRKVAVSGRKQWIKTEIVCTSINLYKPCRKPQQLDLTENLQLTMTEVLKRQCSKSKKGYNQHISVSEVKVDSVHVDGGSDGVTFAVCLDQDEKKFIQSVTRCEVSLCCKPGSDSDWKNYKPLPGQVQPLHPSYCSLLCLPITSFSALYP
ncbi:phosphoinositide 3-kinase regulatory subunit 5-like [Pholidichthys leucotaenia]